MKSVLISIRPEWCEKIASGEKTIEVLKTCPKLKTPFKCYIYCTKQKKSEDGWLAAIFPKSGGCYYGAGSVIGEFTCDQIVEYSCIWGFENGKDCYYNTCSFDEDYTCLTDKQMGEYGRGKPLYGWNISDLKIYDTPKDLGEFVHPCECDNCRECKYDEAYHGAYGDVYYACLSRLERPPQSWCYVEGL